ncbi:MAG: eccB [Amycolatopsis sp.]|jgi:type VII secretion protein EccB|nr:eccB [Amycolatopsis sp.]
MQSALVRRDAVMLNDPMRTHTRATMVGVILGVLGLLGFVIFGLISPAPTVPAAGNIVIGEQSGTVYVVVGNPVTLIPTFNLASARLLLMAQQQGAQAQAAGQAGAAPPAAPAAAQTVANPVVVSDDQLRNIPRRKLTGIPDGPQLLPTASQRISNNWGVCDNLQLNLDLPDPTSPHKVETTVLAGVQSMGNELGQNQALLATADNGKTYLIYWPASSAGQPNANAVRAEVDQSSPAVISALGLSTVKGRQISMALLNAIPEVGKLTAPQIVGDATPPGFQMNGLNIGDVFSTAPTGTETLQYWVVLQGGIQSISRAVSDIIRSSSANGQTAVPPLSLDKINVPRVVQGNPNFLPVSDYPQTVPVVRNPVDQSKVACLGWSLVGDPASPSPHTAVYVGNTMPDKVDAQSIQVGQASPDGTRIDKFYMQAGYGAVIQSATGKDSFGKGPIELISDRGLRYGVPDLKTATGLGLDSMSPAPESIISLLPTGASLNIQAVLQTFDSVPIDPRAGTYPTASAAAPPPGN